MSIYFRKYGEKIECTLCPHFCKVSPGKTGICGVRKNTGNGIELITYSQISGFSLDHVEKKPLYHYFPGYYVFSIGSYGCNMRCDFCQNYSISQVVPEQSVKTLSPSEIVSLALKEKNNIGIAFTYNEPTISFEFIRDVAVEAKTEGLKTVLVSNGYVNREPLSEIIGFIDAFNIDLKAFNNASYRKLTGGDLLPVLNSLTQITASGKHLEITSLIIPGYNDGPEEMISQVEWISAELGQNIPLHLSRYYPMYKRNDPVTPFDTIEKLFRIAAESLNYVYIGNIHSEKGQDTICPSCGLTITERSGYITRNINVDEQGNCSGCKTKIYKNFTFSLKDH
ncbi:MAG TPA: AmmeMemoRadiSam system radical SAM enzyme [Bacteroidales bacterium]|nr:AmmeMemoRadiSam system radical SAM enzyme [Bacteroidales bacterium]